MRKLTVFLAAFFLLFGIAVSANAYQSAYSYSEVDLNSLTYNGRAYWGNLGVITAGAAVADGVIDTYGVLDNWAEAYSSGAYATTGYDDGVLYSGTGVVAGEEYGTESEAFAGSVAMAYSIYVAAGETVTISLEYYLAGAIESDSEDGYSEAASAALLAVMSCDASDGDSAWQYISSDSEVDEYGVSDTLTVTLLGGDEGSSYILFAGTAAYAYAEETSTAPVPEPATMLLLGTGMIGLAGVSRRKMFKK